MGHRERPIGLENVARQSGRQVCQPATKSSSRSTLERNGRCWKIDEGKVCEDGGDQISEDELALPPEHLPTLLVLGTELAEDADAFFDADLEQKQFIREKAVAHAGAAAHENAAEPVGVGREVVGNCVQAYVAVAISGEDVCGDVGEGGVLVGEQGGELLVIG